MLRWPIVFEDLVKSERSLIVLTVVIVIIVIIVIGGREKNKLSRLNWAKETGELDLILIVIKVWLLLLFCVWLTIWIIINLHWTLSLILHFQEWPSFAPFFVTNLQLDFVWTIDGCQCDLDEWLLNRPP